MAREWKIQEGLTDSATGKTVYGDIAVGKPITSTQQAKSRLKGMPKGKYRVICVMAELEVKAVEKTVVETVVE